MEDLWNSKFYLFMWMSSLPAHVSVQHVPYGGHGYQKSMQNPFKREPQMVVCWHAGGLNQSPGRATGAFHHLETSLSISCFISWPWLWECGYLLHNDFKLIFHSLALPSILYWDRPMCAVLVASASRGLLLFHSPSICLPGRSLCWPFLYFSPPVRAWSSV